MKRAILFVILALHVGSLARAGSPPMSWDDCVRELIKNNPQLQATRDTVEKARADVMANYSPFLPQLNAYGDAAKSKTESDDGYSDSTSFGGYLRASQTLFAGFRNRAALDRSRAMLAASEMGLKRMKADLSYTLQSAFSQMLYAQEFVQLSEMIVTRRRDNLNLVELRFEAGREHKGSYLRSRAFLHEAEYDVAQARRSLSVAGRQLATAMGWKDDDALITIAGKWEVMGPSTTPEFLDLIKQTPDHQEAVAWCRAARESVRGARSDYYPELSASASIGREGEDWAPDKNRWSVGMTVSLPLFAGGSHLYAVRGALAEQRVAEANLLDSDNRIAATLEQRFAAWQDAVEQQSVQAEFLNAAEVRAEIARSQYSNGLISFQDWDVIENDLINQEKAMLASRRDAVIAKANWEKAIGTGVIP